MINTGVHALIVGSVVWRDWNGILGGLFRVRYVSSWKGCWGDDCVMRDRLGKDVRVGK